MTGYLPIRVAVWAVIVRDGQILLVEFNDPAVSTPWHFNLPGGGVEPGETLHQAVEREVRKETCAEVVVGDLLFLRDYVPPHPDAAARPHVRAVFQCTLRPGCEPALPRTPDPLQIGVRWAYVDDLPALPLIPPLGPAIRDALSRPNHRDPYLRDRATY
jgi:ADP-ribose pyrophosphatase YjhB (NUDIX family)